jgi:hypothetical protein
MGELEKLRGQYIVLILRNRVHYPIVFLPRPSTSLKVIETPKISAPRDLASLEIMSGHQNCQIKH